MKVFLPLDFGLESIGCTVARSGFWDFAVHLVVCLAFGASGQDFGVLCFELGLKVRGLAGRGVGLRVPVGH